MKIIIDIPDKTYDKVVNDKYAIYDEMYNAIANGTPYEERPKGKWESTKQGDIPITDRCTNCNYKMKWYKNKHKYCPECGANMRG